MASSVRSATTNEGATIAVPAVPDATAASDAASRRLLRRHYENFWVSSWLVPRRLRRHLARIYAYCRTTDDLGDELQGSNDLDRREGQAEAALLRWREDVLRCFGEPPAPRDPALAALAETIVRFRLPREAFLDLIEANLRDQRIHRYPSYAELLDYCRFSAAPVGRLVLRLFGIVDPDLDRLSDDVCIGLQLANFAQDVRVDAARGRSYLVHEGGTSPADAVRATCERAAALLRSGRDLERRVPYRLRLQLSLYRLGGEAILASIRRMGYRTDLCRPRVSNLVKAGLLPRAVFQSWRRDRAELGAAERYCAEMARKEAKNFYWGFIVLPRPKRVAIYALYDFARQVDDEADLAGDGDPRARLARQRERLHGGSSGNGGDPVTRVLRRAIATYGIPLEELEQIIHGVESDLFAPRYRSWTQLEGYCRAVASSVGRTCVRIFGFSDPSAMTFADDLGAAMQLTNILRDVREDMALGRLYLPLEELDRFGLGEQEIASAVRDGVGDGDFSRRWEAFVHFQAGRARALFRSGLRVADLIPRSSAACVLTMAGLYQAILSRIAGNPALVLRERVSLSPASKTRVALVSWLRAGLR